MTTGRVEPEACVLCGSCRAVCPVFEISRNEVDVARGRVARLKLADRTRRFTAADRDAFSRCLLCGRCTEVCKANLDVPTMIQRARERSGYAAALTKLACEVVLGDQRRLGRSLAVARPLAAWLAKLPADSGLRRRFTESYLAAGRLAPEWPAVSYLDRHAGRAASGPQRVALFTGCGVGRLSDGVGEAVDRLLASLGLVAAVPEQGCCGLPAWGIGATEAASTAAARWRETFSDEIQVVLSPCASCTAHLQAMPGDAGPPVEDLFVFLAEQGARFDVGGKRVAVHVPCHTRRGSRGGDAVTGLLRDAGAEIVALPPEIEERCCGMGGTFGAAHPDLSRAIGRPKIEAMLAARPDVIVSHCTGCLLQLRDLVRQAGASTPVLHAALVLAG